MKKLQESFKFQSNAMEVEAESSIEVISNDDYDEDCEQGFLVFKIINLKKFCFLELFYLHLVSQFVVVQIKLRLLQFGNAELLVYYVKKTIHLQLMDEKLFVLALYKSILYI